MRTALEPIFIRGHIRSGMENQHQHHVINYINEDNRVRREQMRLANPAQ